MPDDDAPAAKPEDDAATGRTPRPARTVPLRTLGLALLLVVAVAAVVMAVVQLRRVGELDERADRRTEAATAAARFGEVYLTYDAQDVAASGQRVRELMTSEFAREFDSNRAPGIEEVFSNLGTSTASTTNEVFLGDVTDSTARALVVVDVVASSEASGTQRLTNLSFVLELVRQDGRWLVDSVAPAPQPDVSGDGITDAPTTTTTDASTTTTTSAP